MCLFQITLQNCLIVYFIYTLTIFKTGFTEWITTICYLFLLLGAMFSVTTTITFKIDFVIKCFNESIKMMNDFNITYSDIRLSSLFSFIVFFTIMSVKFYVSVIYLKIFNAPLFLTTNFVMITVNCHHSIAVMMICIAEFAYKKVNKKLTDLKNKLQTSMVLYDTRTMRFIFSLMEMHWRIGDFIIHVNEAFGVQLFFGILSLVFYVFMGIYTFIYMLKYDKNNIYYLFWFVSTFGNFIWVSEIVIRLSSRSHKLCESVSITF